VSELGIWKSGGDAGDLRSTNLMGEKTNFNEPVLDAQRKLRLLPCRTYFSPNLAYMYVLMYIFR
jgi:hypothetical protein